MTQINFTNTVQNALIFETFNQWRRDGKFCDVTFLVGTRKISVHRLVVAAACPYFQTMFAMGFSESQQSEVRINDMDEDAFARIIDYFYSSKLVMNSNNAVDMLRVASLLQLADVIKRVSEYLDEQLDASNCIGISAFCETLPCPDLQSSAETFILEHFKDVVKSDEFLSVMSPDHLLKILKHSGLQVTNENLLLESLMAWIEHDLPTRKHFLPRMLKYVRLPLLGRKFISETFASHPLITEDKMCCEHLKNAIDYLESVKQRASTGQAVFIVGLSHSESFVSCFGLDMWPVSWRKVATYKFNSDSSVCVGNTIYTCSNRPKIRVGACNLDLKSDKWYECCSPYRIHSTFYKLIALDDQLCILNLATFQGAVSTGLQMFNAAENSWTDIGDLPFPFDLPIRQNPIQFASSHLVSLGCLLYYFDTQTKTVFCYDYKTRNYTSHKSKVPQGRMISIVTMNNCIYLMFHDYAESSVNVYDPITNAWSTCGDNSTPRYLDSSLAACNGRLFMICRNFKTVFVYEKATNEWTLCQGLTLPTTKMKTHVVTVPVLKTGVPMATDLVDISLVRDIACQSLTCN